MKTGEAVKSGRKKYRFVKDGMECRVSSVRAEVLPVGSSPILIRN
jgi:hypothetical protein